MSSQPNSAERAASSRLAGLTRGFSSLSSYNYRLYWSGQLISQVGTWMQNLAQAWLVLKLTNSPLALGTITTLQFLPITLFSLYGGVLADRFPKRSLLLTTQSVATIQAIVLALLTSLGLIRLWELYLLALILGLANALDNPTRQAFPVELVGREQVGNAVALNSTLYNTSRIVGPSLAGLAIATIGVAGCFWLNAASFLAVIGGLLLMKPSRFYAVPKRQRGSTRELLIGGLNYAIRTPAVCVLVIGMLFFGTFAYNFNTFLPLLARFTLHTSSVRYGFLFAGLGFGSLGGALTLAYARARSLRMVFLSGAGFVVTLLLLGISHHYPLSLLMLALMGIFSVVYSTTTQSRLQTIVPDELRGRVMSLYTLLFLGTTPIGSLFVGVIAEHWSVGTVIELCGLFSLAGLALAWFYYRRTHGRETPTAAYDDDAQPVAAATGTESSAG